jgi:hypothetical protein
MVRTVGRWDLNVATKTSFRNFLQSEGMPNSATGRANSDQGLPTHYKGSVRHPLRQNTCPVRGIFLGGEKRSPCGLRVEDSKGLACKPNRGLQYVGESHPLRLCERLGYTIVQEYTDSGISSVKSRNDRPAPDTLTKDTTGRRFDMVMCWSIDRLGRSILIHAPKS